MQISTRSPPPGFEPITDRLLIQSNDPHRDRQFREMAQPQPMFSWNKPFMPTVVKSEFFPPPATSTWPPSPPGQEFLLGGYFPGSQQQQQQQFFQVPDISHLHPAAATRRTSPGPSFMRICLDHILRFIRQSSNFSRSSRPSPRLRTSGTRTATLRSPSCTPSQTRRQRQRICRRQQVSTLRC